MERRKLSFFTVDVEEDLGTAASRPREFMGVTNGLPLLLDVLDSLKIDATFFVTGEVALEFPELIKGIPRNHEVACHGFSHIEVKKLDFRTNHKNLLRNIETLYEITGRKPLGFRAVDNMIDDCFISLLEKLEFTYDSSVLTNYPLFKKYSGFEGVTPSYPYHPNRNNYRKKGDLKILEMPISTTPIINFPWVGTWIRTWGRLLYELNMLVTRPPYLLIALHSWDLADLKGKTLYSRNSGKHFAETLKDLILFLTERGYTFQTLIAASRLYA